MSRHRDLALNFVVKEEYREVFSSVIIKGNSYSSTDGCPTAHCERYKPHFDFGDIPSPIVPHRNKLQTQGGMTAH